MVVVGLLLASLICLAVGLLLASSVWLALSLAISAVAALVLAAVWFRSAQGSSAATEGRVDEDRVVEDRADAGGAGEGGGSESDGSESDGSEVWVVDGTARYHRAGCEIVAGQDVESIPINQADDDGLIACSLCEPASAAGGNARRSA